jgi:hypothetical protein
MHDALQSIGVPELSVDPGFNASLLTIDAEPYELMAIWLA